MTFDEFYEKVCGGDLPHCHRELLKWLGEGRQVTMGGPLRGLSRAAVQDALMRWHTYQRALAGHPQTEIIKVSPKDGETRLIGRMIPGRGIDITELGPLDE